MNYENAKVANYIGGPEQSVRNAEVPKALASIGTGLDVLEKAVDQMIERCQPVLRGESTQAGNGVDTPRAIPMSTLGQQLDSVNQRLRSAVLRLEAAHQRLEI